MNSILSGSMLCPTLDDSQVVMVIVQMLADVTLLDTYQKSGAGRI
jgi:hypothetical protein